MERAIAADGTAILTIAGLDPSGGAGVLADARAIQACGRHAAAVVTSTTLQNTAEMRGARHVPSRTVGAQLNIVLDDLPPAAVKTGMLATAATVRVVSRVLARRCHGVPLVVDPVMVSSSGHPLLSEAGCREIVHSLLPLATVTTPNLSEAARLASLPPLHTVDDMAAAARAIHTLGCAHVLVTGGHLATDRSPDAWFDGRRVRWLDGVRLPSTDPRGTGCTLSAVLAAELGAGRNPLEAARRAKRYVTDRIRQAIRVGAGRPVLPT
jgi:hydroxymethylpyrimidine/phosphomethylpyrimidine kinase